MTTAPTSTDDDGNESRWGFDSDDTPPLSWRPAETPILNSLLTYVPQWTERPPWLPGYELDIHGQGGLVSKERRRYTIVGHGAYSNHVGGHLNLVADSQDIRCARQRTVRIARPGDTGGMNASWGLDALTVDGDASHEVGSRTLMLSGTVNRLWNGGVMRMASMEGVICGGAFARIIASPSGTLSGLMSGDVYGGCARVSRVRSYVAVLHYRAAQSAAWALGIYLRKASFTIEPIVSSPSAGTPKSKIESKMARLAKVANVARMVCPVLDIAAGIVMMPMAIVGIIALIRSAVRKQNPVPPAGPPRLRTRKVGVSSQTLASTTHV